MTVLPLGDSRIVSQSTSAERSRADASRAACQTASGVLSQRASAGPATATAVGGVGGEGDGVGPGVGVVRRVGEGGEGEGATVAARAGVALDDGESSGDVREPQEGGVEGHAGAGVGAGDLEEGGPRAVVGGAPQAVAARGVGCR